MLKESIKQRCVLQKVPQNPLICELTSVLTSFTRLEMPCVNILTVP